MTLSLRLAEYIAAAFTGIWVQSHEHADALTEIAQLCRNQKWAMAAWDVDRGMQVAGQAAGSATDPVAAVKAVNSLATKDGSALLVLPNFHRFLQSAEVVQALAHQVQQGKQNRTFVVILSPVVQVPVELEKHFVVVDHDLPDRQQLEAIARGVATEDGELATGEDLVRLLDAAAGLTRYEAEGAFALSLVRHGRLEPRAVWELKEGMLKKSGLLTLHRGTERFDDLGGLDALKAFCARALAAGRRSGPARPRGVLLLSPPGCGKSQFCKALGNETGRPTLVMDVGALLGSLVGQSEANLRQALRIVDAMAPCVLMVDEVEKALAGVASSGSTDSGVSARMFGSLLTYLSDHTTDVFVACTANDISKLPPEFVRAERFDAVYYVDLPGTAERDKIWPMYLRRYGLDVDLRRPEDRDWTGAEIASCCRLAALLDVPVREAARNVVPVAVTAAESVERLRNWASGRCLSASQPGIYARGGTDAPASGRRVAPGIDELTGGCSTHTASMFLSPRRLTRAGGSVVSIPPTRRPTMPATLNRGGTAPPPPASTSSSASAVAAARRLRQNFAAVRVLFTWFGVRKSLSAEQKAQAAESFGAEGGYLSAAKKLLDTKHEAFQQVTAVRSQIISYWKGLSLPYPDPGVRLIRHDDVDRFNTRMTAFRDELDAAVSNLDDHFGQLRAAARDRLGSLYNDADYPPNLRGLFGVAFDFPSCEPPEYLLRLNPHLYEQERQRIATRFDEAVQLAEEAFVAEFGKLVAHLSERLTAGPDGQQKVFRDSAVGNLTAFFERFKSLNVRSNADLDRLVETARQALSGVDPHIVRNSTSLRQQVTTQLSAVQSVLDGMLVDQPRRRILRQGRGPAAEGTAG